MLQLSPGPLLGLLVGCLVVVLHDPNESNNQQVTGVSICSMYLDFMRTRESEKNVLDLFCCFLSAAVILPSDLRPKYGLLARAGTSSSVRRPRLTQNFGAKKTHEEVQVQVHHFHSTLLHSTTPTTLQSKSTIPPPWPRRFLKRIAIRK